MTATSNQYFSFIIRLLKFLKILTKTFKKLKNTKPDRIYFSQPSFPEQDVIVRIITLNLDVVTSYSRAAYFPQQTFLLRAPLLINTNEKLNLRTICNFVRICNREQSKCVWGVRCEVMNNTALDSLCSVQSPRHQRFENETFHSSTRPFLALRDRQRRRSIFYFNRCNEYSHNWLMSSIIKRIIIIILFITIRHNIINIWEELWWWECECPGSMLRRRDLVLSVRPSMPDICSHRKTSKPDTTFSVNNQLFCSHLVSFNINVNCLWILAWETYFHLKTNKMVKTSKYLSMPTLEPGQFPGVGIVTSG